MRVVVTGGGSAGHVKPILAVAAEIKSQQPEAQVIFVRQIGDKDTLNLLKNTDENIVDQIKGIAAGKFRRYHGVSWQKQVLDVKMQLLNIRDALFFVIGLKQSFFMLLLLKPDVVFVKGGYVGLPVGLCASLLRIPLILHESDVKMGLTNRILSRYALAVGVGMPEDNYQLGNTTISFVGVPVSSDYKFVGPALQAKYKKQLNIDPKKRVVVITGGSRGAERVNNIVVAIGARLAHEAHVIHQTGQETYQATKKAIEDQLTDETRGNYQLLPFIERDMQVYLGAADVVVARVGTTTMAELAITAKPLVLIPNPKLVYGHQLENAKIYQSANAAVVVDEELAIQDPSILLDNVLHLLNSSAKREKLATNLHRLAKPSAAKDIAKLILSKT